MQEEFEPNPRAVIGGNNPPDDTDLSFLDARIVLLGAEFLQFTYGELENLFISGKARAAKRRMGFRRILSYCLAEVVSQTAQGDVMNLTRDTIGDDQAAVRKCCELDDEFAEYVEDTKLGMIGFIRARTNQERFEARLKHWTTATPNLKRKRDARAIISATAKALSREGLGVLSRVVIAEATKKRLRQEAFREIESGLKECFAEGLITDAEPSELKHAPRKPDAQRQVAPTKQGALVYAEAVALGLVGKPKRRGA